MADTVLIPASIESDFFKGSVGRCKATTLLSLLLTVNLIFISELRVVSQIQRA